MDNKIRFKIELQIKDNYKNLFKERGKSFIEIDHEKYLLHSDSLPEFNKASSSKKSYYQFDLRPIKNQFKDYEIDELLYVEVDYGLDYNNPMFLVETRHGYCTIKSEIVDLNVYLGVSVAQLVCLSHVPMVLASASSSPTRCSGQKLI